MRIARKVVQELESVEYREVSGGPERPLKVRQGCYLAPQEVLTKGLSVEREGMRHILKPQSEMHGECHRIATWSTGRPVETHRQVGFHKIGFEKASFAFDGPAFIQ